jgi:adenylate cyclase, class 2
MNNIEYEVRFLDIDKESIINKAIGQGYSDQGEKFLRETIFYDKDLKWRDENKYARLRTYGGKTKLTYKHIKSDTVDGAEEIEFEVSDESSAMSFLLKLNLIAFRTQEKKRRTLTKGDVTLDIDTWPTIPTYLEIEGKSEEDVRAAANELGFDYTKASFLDARKIIESYGVDVSAMKYFTFDIIA